LPKAYPLLSTTSEDRISAFRLVVPFVSLARIVTPAALAGLFFAGVSPAVAMGEVVTGDSLGVGIAMASGFENRAANSVSIRGGHAVDQLRRVRPGSTVFMSLGTNDAVGSIRGLDKGIDKIVETAKASRLKLIWIGPPCVIKTWDNRAVELDGILRERLAGTGITYVSMRDPSLCSPSARGSDGVHFNMEGYRNMWSRVAAASGYQVASVTPAAPVANSKKKLRKDEVAVRQQPEQQTQPRETPRVRTTVTAASLMPMPLTPNPRSNNKRGSIAGEYFSFGFRWPETVRSSGHYFPAD
jgi:hypothetical protein